MVYGSARHVLRELKVSQSWFYRVLGARLRKLACPRVNDDQKIGVDHKN